MGIAGVLFFICRRIGEKYKLKLNSMQVEFITNLKKILKTGEDMAFLVSVTVEAIYF